MRYLLALLISFSVLGADAQKSRIGYINTNVLWSKMPEKAEADSLLNLKRIEFQQHLKSLQEEYQQKVTEVQNDSTTDRNSALFKEKVSSIQSLEKRINSFTGDAEKELKAYQDTLYTPIREKMQNAIDKVADDRDYEYILDASFGHMIYRKNESYNILPDVLEELNL